MNYQQTGRIAIVKKIAGWVLFIPAVISTVVSVLNFLFIHSDKQPGIDAVLSDFLHVMIDMIKFNTHSWICSGITPRPLSSIPRRM